jgi:hypothetical protein
MPAERKGMSKGCMIALIVFGIIAIIVLALAIVCYIYQDRILEWGLEKSTRMVAQEIKANLPENVTADEVDELMEKFIQAVKDKKVEAADLQNIATSFQKALEDKKIDADESKMLLEEIGKIVGEEHI